MGEKSTPTRSINFRVKKKTLSRAFFFVRNVVPTVDNVLINEYKIIWLMTLACCEQAHACVFCFGGKPKAVESSKEPRHQGRVGSSLRL